MRRFNLSSPVAMFFCLLLCTSMRMVTSLTSLRPTTPQNVLLIISDDLRAEIDALGFGCTAVKCHTPHLKNLSASTSTTTFTRAYVQQALCAPTRNSFLTGRRPDTTKSWNFVNHFREALPHIKTLPQVFKDVANYSVFGTGKVFHPHLPPHWDPPSWDKAMYDGRALSWMYPSEPRCPEGNVWCGLNSTDVSDYDDLQVTQRALALLSNLTSKEKPWFLAVGFRKPHVQWRIPIQHLNNIPSNSVTLPKYPLFPKNSPSIAYHQPIGDFVEPFTDVLACGGLSNMEPNASYPPHCQYKWRRAYHASVSFMDEQVGILMNALIKHDVYDNTVVCFFGDHGWSLGEASEWEKFTNFEMAARVPLIIRAPWLKSGIGKMTRTLVELVDIMPTLIELATPATIVVPAGVEGTSLVPFMELKNSGGENKSGENKSENKSVVDGKVVSGKTVVLTQFPRCVTDWSAMWKRNDCDNVDRRNFTHMGLSLRTNRWRFTRWMQWDGELLMPKWRDDDDGLELYDHFNDDGLSMDGNYEHTNVALNFPNVVHNLTVLLEVVYAKETS